MNTHQENIKQYLSLGGDPKKIKQLTAANLQNRARLAYLLSQLESAPASATATINAVTPAVEIATSPVVVTAPVPPPERKKGVFSDFISQYPTELHETYKKRYEHWLEACSLKVSLNEVPENDVEVSLVIQDKIMKCFKNFDACQEALDYYNEKKRVLPVKSSEDFSKLSPVELLKLRNNLRSQITKRKATVKKKQSEIPDPASDQFKMKQNGLNRKVEELREIELQLREVERLVK